jgi:hypothetical protein
MIKKIFMNYLSLLWFGVLRHKLKNLDLPFVGITLEVLCTNNFIDYGKEFISKSLG